MTDRIDYNHIVSQISLEARLHALDEEIRRVGYVCLTDAIINYNYAGHLVLLHLADRDKHTTGQRATWRLKVLRDTWGNDMPPGSKVTREVQRQPKDRAGRRLRANVIADMKRRGTWEQRYTEKREFIVDPKGCIECGLDDALFFLQEHGVNFERPAEAICGRRELSSGPMTVPGLFSQDGKPAERHAWYWLYCEVPPWAYNDMPTIGKKSK